MVKTGGGGGGSGPETTTYPAQQALMNAKISTGSGGGGTHLYHWSENRALTNRERARLQTFDDDYNRMMSERNQFK